MCVNNNKKKINPTQDRPDEIRPESDPTRPHLFSNPTGPERKRHWRVHSLQPRIGPEKSRGPADLAAAPHYFHSVYLLISLLLYIFACLMDTCYFWVWLLIVTSGFEV